MVSPEGNAIEVLHVGHDATGWYADVLKFRGDTEPATFRGLHWKYEGVSTHTPPRRWWQFRAPQPVPAMRYRLASPAILD